MAVWIQLRNCTLAYGWWLYTLFDDGRIPYSRHTVKYTSIGLFLRLAEPIDDPKGDYSIVLCVSSTTTSVGISSCWIAEHWTDKLVTVILLTYPMCVCVNAHTIIEISQFEEAQSVTFIFFNLSTAKGPNDPNSKMVIGNRFLLLQNGHETHLYWEFISPFHSVYPLEEYLGRHRKNIQFEIITNQMYLNCN